MTYAYEDGEGPFEVLHRGEVVELTVGATVTRALTVPAA